MLQALIDKTLLLGCGVMKPRISVLTIGVDDLEYSLRFYKEGLGLETEGIVGKEFEHGAVVFFNMKGGLILALYPRKEIAWDAKIQLDSHSSTEFTIGHLVNSKKEVDEVMGLAEKSRGKDCQICPRHILGRLRRVLPRS